MARGITASMAARDAAHNPSLAVCLVRPVRLGSVLGALDGSRELPRDGDESGTPIHPAGPTIAAGV
jgi:hypothetical protein